MNYYLFITFIFNKLAVNLNFIGSQSVVKTNEIFRRILFVLAIFKINHVVGLTTCRYIINESMIDSVSMYRRHWGSGAPLGVSRRGRLNKYV